MEKVTDIISKINLKDYLEKYYNIEFTHFNKCRCINPNHDDNNPSMQYYEDSNRLVCFSCEGEYHKKPINIISATALLEGLECRGDDFKKVLDIICQRYNIPYNKESFKISKEKRELYEKKNEFAKEYIKNLWSEEGFNGMEFLLNRGITKETIKAFSLGLTSPNEYKYHLSGISNRISIPILDETHSVCAMSFRSLDMDSKDCKYINDKKDIVWDKKSTLYGLPNAIEHIRRNNLVYLVEGYFDVMSMHQAGVKNTVGYMGGALTKEQMEKVSKYTNNVVLIADQDKTGVESITNTTIDLTKMGMNVNVISDLDFLGKDMNDVCNTLKWDKAKIHRLLRDNSKNAILFLSNKIFCIYNEKVIDYKLQTKKMLNAIFECIPDTEKREHYKKEYERLIN